MNTLFAALPKSPSLVAETEAAAAASTIAETKAPKKFEQIRQGRECPSFSIHQSGGDRPVLVHVKEKGTQESIEIIARSPFKKIECLLCFGGTRARYTLGARTHLVNIAESSVRLAGKQTKRKTKIQHKKPASTHLIAV